MSMNKNPHCYLFFFIFINELMQGVALVKTPEFERLEPPSGFFGEAI